MKLSADPSVGKLRLLDFRDTGGAGVSLEKSFFPTLDSKTKATVLELIPGGVWLGIGGKKFRAQTDHPLFSGEVLTLVVQSGKKGIELKILEREVSTFDSLLSKSQPMDSGILELTEKIGGLESKEVPPENAIFKILKSYYPFLEWNAELPYFRWEVKDGNAEGIFDSNQEEKKFLFRVQTEKTGRTLVLFVWKEISGEDLLIHATFDNFKMYLHACQNAETFKRILTESSVQYKGYNLSYKPFVTRKEWNA
ncbi:hypothetical protein EHQ12_15630 [Leptospira gomenensis]|uniref:Uncharacterized protein n=1 Tax=Leptospira gomenensis TaxID=2484974 RepID=A0A5F1YC97_9LEPT|nr:hypothetical protein [Leptospira gomenensis]TGK35031.1 hypothetical protein EHQ12_15630 [Leptospira gomenensis]TGK35291.1 hypothetical protein EHQ17_07595 [Leptospira gomenensis]TGK51776.1 hypothetical protein EHQ07_02095 [Leptospira gomenensis]TGK58371.1 hypothetical protein EHQ13_14000 [Leptospira gomenensis]